VALPFTTWRRAPFEEFGSALSRCREGHNTVVIAMDHQRRNIHASQVLSEVFMPGWNTSQASRRRRAGGDIPTGLDDLLTDALTQEQIGIVEILEEFAEENVSISSYCFLNAIEYARKVVSGPVLELKGKPTRRAANQRQRMKCHDA